MFVSVITIENVDSDEEDDFVIVDVIFNHLCNGGGKNCKHYLTLAHAVCHAAAGKAVAA